MDPALNRELVAGLQRGEPDAFERAYAALRPRLFAFLARLAQRRDLAEDLLQETWLRLARHAHRLRDDTVLSAWLFTVARNLHASYRRWTLVDLARREGVRGAPTDSPPSPFDLTAASELELRLELALAALSVADREVLLLIGVEAMSHEDAAAVLGLRPATLRKRLSRARSRLENSMTAPESSALSRREVPV